MAALKTFNAEGGTLQLYAVSPADAQVEAQANEQEQVYFGKHGVELGPGDVVLDIGANVGSTARMAARAVGPSGTVYCVEPFEDVCTALRKNIELWGDWAQHAGLQVGCMVVVQAGCGDGSSESRTFTHYCKLTAMSSMYPDEADAAAAVYSLIRNKPYGATPLENVARLAARWLPSFYKLIHTTAFRALLLRPARQVDCPMTTVSKIIEQHSIKEVGLLKANVERAEEDVLAGVAPQHWARIRQVSLQVHDINGRVARMQQLLESQGFEVVVWKEPRFVDCCLFMIYGVKRG